MKKLVVLKSFYDKYTNELYNINDVVEFDNKRADEILNNASNLAEPIIDSHTSKTSKRKKKTEVCENE